VLTILSEVEGQIQMLEIPNSENKKWPQRENKKIKGNM